MSRSAAAAQPRTGQPRTGRRRATQPEAGEPDLWRARARPGRPRPGGRLPGAPATTGALASQLPELSRFAVMQHLGVLTEAGVVIVERRGRDRINHLNPIPLREWYERWVQPMADTGAAGLLALKRSLESGEPVMVEPDQVTQPPPADQDTAEPADAGERVRTVRLAFELRIAASAERTFEVLTRRSLEWFPHTYGEDRVRRIVLEPRVGGRHYEDWGDGRGHLYGEVTVYDPPLRWATRGRVYPGTILDTEHDLSEEDGASVVRVTKVAVGPLTAEQAAGIARFGDMSGYAPAISKLAAG
jgi:DNA-binding transcriptional ArsR family regulator/uncharacterized protein YndB with AHSA1/START domain